MPRKKIGWAATPTIAGATPKEFPPPGINLFSKKNCPNPPTHTADAVRERYKRPT